MNPKLFLQLAAAGRMSLGAVLLVAPQLAGRIIGNETSTATANVVTRVAGVRDLVVGAGTFRALQSGTDAADWVTGSALCDLVDSASHAAAINDIPKVRNIGTIIGAAGFGVAQLKALRDLRASN